ncbi:hypothetical protein [Thalassovita aquimarina]|uniref:DUF2783 domain-containing protein n=1 Tax=Thalassovita aquimarina TaxID=2785917 RepID=A0ABS5HL99_9RHOB|nr:hypothetical protein [Thalassovita aquimarina]MBR9649745.1 DUF2783 domain-containing protein [Thalassovita aquimarina]
MTPAEVETIYEALANRLDDLGAEKRELYLAKLALLMAHELEDAPRALTLIAEAAENLDA